MPRIMKQGRNADVDFFCCTHNFRTTNGVTHTTSDVENSKRMLESRMKSGGISEVNSTGLVDEPETLKQWCVKEGYFIRSKL